MSYINVGAYRANGDPIKTKKALKEAVENMDVAFWQTALRPFQDRTLSGVFGVDKLPEGKTLVVVGPDPETSRKWYANVVRVGDRVRVS